MDAVEDEVQRDENAVIGKVPEETVSREQGKGKSRSKKSRSKTGELTRPGGTGSGA